MLFARWGAGWRADGRCLDLNLGGAEGTQGFGDPVAFTLLPDLGLLLACCGCRDYVTLDAHVTQPVTNATSSTWPRDRCTANFAAESSFPGFALLIPPPHL